MRLRIINMGMDHHPIHLHGNQFVMTGTEGGRAPESTWYPMNTVLVGVAQARVVEFDAKYPGAWMVHCHLPHHMMNSMMDLLKDRAIETANTTDAKALAQMETRRKAFRSNTCIILRSPKMQTAFQGFRKMPSWKWGWMTPSTNPRRTACPGIGAPE